jgi:hypothetical protein
MYGPGHYVEAERLAAKAAATQANNELANAAALAAIAQVHATLAHAAATALAASGTESQRWAEVAVARFDPDS